MEVWKKEGRKRRFETPPRRGLKARREVCLRGGSRGVQKSFMQNASAWRRQMAARSFLCPNAASKTRLAPGSAYPHAGRGRAKAAGGAHGWQAVLPQVRQDLHQGALIRMPVAAGQKPQGAHGWQAVLPQISGLARGSAYPHAGDIRETPQGERAGRRFEHIAKKQTDKAAVRQRRRDGKRGEVMGKNAFDGVSAFA